MGTSVTWDGSSPPITELDGSGILPLPSDQDSSGRSMGSPELAYLRQVIESGTLTSTKGTYVKALEAAFAESIGSPYVTACASGTAAVHAAVAAIDPEPGDEIITTPITDMGALAPILYQGAIPVFADVDPETGNVTASTVSERITDRTRGIIVTHLFGNPVDVDGIMAVARAHSIPVIEDAAQAFGATVGGRAVGTIGDIGCFSLQQGKHITTGEGGLIATANDAMARRIRLFVNKAWPYGEANPDHEFLAPNYRLSELQGAVGLAQLERLTSLIDRRIEAAQQLTSAIESIAGLGAPVVAPDAVHSYWRYTVRVDPSVVKGGPDAVAQSLRHYDVASAPRYVRKPAFACAVFTNQRTFGESRWPFTLAAPEAVDYSRERFPGTYSALASMLVLPFNEKYDARHVAYLATSLAHAVEA